MKITPTEAIQVANEIADRAEEERRISYEKEAQFEARVAFATYAEDALLLFHDILTMTDEAFFDKYKTLKGTFVEKIAELEVAIREHDYQKRNQLYDYFIEIL